LARPQRSVSALVAIVVLAGLLAAGQWLQPRLDGRTKAAATTRPAPTAPTPTRPAPTSPILATARPAGPSHIRRLVATSSPVDAIAVTRQALWLAVGGLVLRIDPATGRALVVPEVDTGAPVVDLTAGAGAVWAVTSSAGLLRIDPGTARLTAPNPGPVSAIAAGAGAQAQRRHRQRGLWLAATWEVNCMGPESPGGARPTVPTHPHGTRLTPARPTARPVPALPPATGACAGRRRWSVGSRGRLGCS
jgi:hypothetical protein